MLSLVGCSQEVERSIDVQDFDKVRLIGQIELRLLVGDEREVWVIGAEQALAAATHDVLKGRLTLTSPHHGIVAQITVPAIAAIELLGQASADLDELYAMDDLRLASYAEAQLHIGRVSSQQLDIRASGSARVSIDSVVAEELVLLGSGESKIALSGSVESALVNISADSDLAAESLRLQRLEVMAAGNARGALWATAHISGSVQGHAEINVRGAPDSSVERSGQATLSLSGEQ